MRLSTVTTIFLSVPFATATLHAEDGVKAATNEATAVKRVEGWLEQFENTQEGDLPETFCVRIEFDGYMNRKTEKGIHFYRPREVYEFTPKEMRRLCIRAAGVDEEGGTKYRVDEEGYLVYEVAAKKPFTKIDRVCRILLALDYLEMVSPDENTTGKNLHHLQVMTDSGLRPLGNASIEVTAADTELYYCESCLFAGSPTSAQSIRFAALYHTLRRLARSELALSADDWNDALDIIDVDGSLKPAAGTFRARD